MNTISRVEKANAIRALSMDAVQKAKSGHPGAPMGMADIAEVLWSGFLNHNPANPNWANRDRFVLSNGHGSMLIYSLLHLSGYDLSIDDIKQFRQLHSKTPGHPEYGYAPGVETTTGPLGQGLANAVGMAIAEKTLAAQFNRDDYQVVDHHTYVFTGDGCLMEGISHEVCSLAGTLGLGKLIVLYDDNGISIDGEVEGWFTDDTPARFRAYGWQVIEHVDGHDPVAVERALNEAKAESNKPTLVCCKTIIGYGSPNKQGKESCHGAPLGDEEIALVRAKLNWPHAPFEIPADVYAAWDAKEAGQQKEQAWNALFAAYASAYPQLADEFDRRIKGELPAHWHEQSEQALAAVNSEAKTIATRAASKEALNKLAPMLPELIGGSADLTGSNLTYWDGSKEINQDPAGNYIFYGVREFGMSAIMNGMALHAGFKPYGATFLMFSEYARNALRMAALMQQPSIFVFTHDSIGLGEDGPTHQPVEQTATLRLMPNMSVWRPCDSYESIVAWQQACESTTKPFSLIFSRQALQFQQRDAQTQANVKRGGYILRDCDGQPDIILIATGSEVELAMQVAQQLEAKVRVVSMPSVDRFEAQDEDYRQQVLPQSVTRRLVIEAGVTDGWYKYAGFEGDVLGINRFGESAPANDVFEYLGVTVENAVQKAKTLLNS